MNVCMQIRILTYPVKGWCRIFVVWKYRIIQVLSWKTHCQVRIICSLSCIL